MSHPYVLLLRRFGRWTRRSLSFLWLVVVAGYLSVLAGQAVYRNYQSQQEIVGLKNQLAQRLREEQQLSALLIYYHTDSFKEKELRRALLLKRPEETVYALPESSVAKKLEDEVVQATKEVKKVSTDPIWKQWLQYIWYGERAG